MKDKWSGEFYTVRRLVIITVLILALTLTACATPVQPPEYYADSCTL